MVGSKFCQTLNKTLVNLPKAYKLLLKWRIFSKSGHTKCKCEFYTGNNHAQLSHCVGKVVALPIFKLENQSSNPGNMTKRNHMNAQKGKYHSYKMLLEEMTSSQRLKKSGSSVFPVWTVHVVGIGTTQGAIRYRNTYKRIGS